MSEFFLCDWVLRLFFSSVQERKILSFTFCLYYNFAADNPNNFIFADDIEHRLDHWKGLHHFRLALIFDKAQGLLFHSVGRTSRSHNSRFKRSEAAKQMKPLIEAKYFGSTRRSLKLGSFQQSVSERTSFLSLRFVSNSIHLVTICLFFSFNSDHSILKT